MHKRKIINYHQNVIDRVIAAQILADRAGLNNYQKQKLIEKTKKSEARDSKKNNFIRLANKRVSNAINSIKLVKNLSNKSLYKYNDKDVKEILKVLKKEYYAIRKKFK